MPAQPFYLLSFSALFSGRVVSSNILAMLPMTSSQVHLWSIGLWMLIGVLIISPTAGGGGLGRLRCNVDSEGGKYTSASPRCTCLPPRQHCAEVALGAFTTDSSAMLTRRGVVKGCLQELQNSAFLNFWIPFVLFLQMKFATLL